MPLPRHVWTALLLLCLAGAGGLSVWLGQDANWDLRNYHIYNAWAALNGRSSVDQFAAGLQTYFNPTLDLPYYLLAFEWLGDQPRAVAFLAGLPYGALVFLAILCAVTVLADFRLSGPRLYVSAALLVAFGVTGSATLPQVGTTFNEIQVAVLILAGVVLMLSSLKSAPAGRISVDAAFIGAGLLFGLAAGLKLTAGIYAPAAAIAVFVATQDRRRGLRAAALFSVAWAAAFAATYGWWALRLYHETGNPMFPLLENLFQTRWLSGGSWLDSQFKPKSALQAVFYPFYWIRADRAIVAEPVFSDPRFAVAMLAFLLMGAVGAFARLRGVVSVARHERLPTIPVTSQFLLVFVAISYVVWLKAFSVLRYTVPIEALMGLAMGVIALSCAALLKARVSAVAALACLGLLLVAVAAATRYPVWGRTAYGDNVLKVEEVKLDRDSLLLVLGPPQAYLLPEIARQNPTVQFVGIPDELINAREFDLWRKVQARVLAFPGTRYAIVRKDEPRPRMDELGGLLGLHVDAPSCRSFSSSIDRLGFQLCGLRPAPHGAGVAR